MGPGRHARGRAAEGGVMKVPTAFAAITACRFVGAREPALRQDDSGAKSLLPGATESAIVRAMTNAPSALPHDVDALHALIHAAREAHAAAIAERNAIAVERDQLAVRTTKLEQIVAEMRRALYGRRSERIDDNQLALALEALETEYAKTEAEAEKTNPALKTERTRQRRKSRSETLDHLPNEEHVIEPESKVCPCCGGDLHKIGEDVSKRLDKVPAKLVVVVTRRPKLACRSCERTGADEVAGIIQAPAPARLIEGGLPTERLVADVVVSKFADHLPLYRQSQILARSGVKIEGSTLAGWAGTAAGGLGPLHTHLGGKRKASRKLFCDETRCPVLDPGRGQAKTGFMWAIARDGRPYEAGLGLATPGIEHRAARLVTEQLRRRLQLADQMIVQLLDRRPAERTAFKSLGHEAHTGAVPPLWSDRGRRGVDNHWERQIFRFERRNVVLRGESSPVRRSGSRRRRLTACHDDGSPASPAPHSGQGRVPGCGPDNRARCASAPLRLPHRARTTPS